MQLSLVLPAFNAEPFISETLTELQGFLGARREFFGDFEIIVVDDGSEDGTLRVVAERFPEVRAIRLPGNRGKGAAVRRGMLAARGGVRVFMDCDAPYQLDAITAIFRQLEGRDCAVCIGARDLSESTYQVPRGRLRRASSVFFTLLISRIVLPGLRDTQCGIKGFRADAAQALFGGSKIDGFAFDVEILYLARKWRIPVGRVPVRFVHDAPSSVRLFRDSLRMLVDVASIWLHHRGHRRPSPAGE